VDLAGTEVPVLLPLLGAVDPDDESVVEPVAVDDEPVVPLVAVEEEPVFGLVETDEDGGIEAVGGAELGGPAGDEVGLTEGEGETGVP
jgi:hypothetical protein